MPLFINAQMMREGNVLVFGLDIAKCVLVIEHISGCMALNLVESLNVKLAAELTKVAELLSDPGGSNE